MHEGEFDPNLREQAGDLSIPKDILNYKMPKKLEITLEATEYGLNPLKPAKDLAKIKRTIRTAEDEAMYNSPQEDKADKIRRLERVSIDIHSRIR